MVVMMMTMALTMTIFIAPDYTAYDCSHMLPKSLNG